MIWDIGSKMQKPEPGPPPCSTPGLQRAWEEPGWAACGKSLCMRAMRACVHACVLCNLGEQCKSNASGLYERTECVRGARLVMSAASHGSSVCESSKRMVCVQPGAVRHCTRSAHGRHCSGPSGVLARTALASLLCERERVPSLEYVRTGVHQRPFALHHTCHVVTGVHVRCLRLCAETQALGTPPSRPGAARIRRWARPRPLGAWCRSKLCTTSWATCSMCRWAVPACCRASGAALSGVVGVVRLWGAARPVWCVRR